MIHSIYCKINEFHANFRLLEHLLNSHDNQTLSNDFKLRSTFTEAYPIVSEHLQCLKKAKNKIPNWVSSGCIFAKKAYEQCTSEEIANYHAAKFKNQKVLSITGGLGVDDHAFYKNGATVVSLDTDPGMNALFRYNAEKLNATEINRLDEDAETYLQACKTKFDLVFADPDRRPLGQRTQGYVEEHSPDVFRLYRQYKQIAPYWLFKLSPMTDITWLFQLQEISMDIEVIQHEGEVKELLCHLHKGANRQVNLVDIGKAGVKCFDHAQLKIKTHPTTVFIEPLPGTIKAGLHRQIESSTGLNARNKQQTYFTGMGTMDSALVRNFELEHELQGSLTQIGVALKELKIEKANVSCREFVLTPEALRKKLKIKDGGDVYLFFSGSKVKQCFVCKKL